MMLNKNNSRHNKIDKCWRVFAMLLTTLFFCSQTAHANDAEKVQVVDPFIELHTGPGDGHPIFQLVKKNGWITILARKTDWFRVRTEQGIEGWVYRTQMEQTLTTSGSQTKFRDLTFADLSQRKWEAGALAGDFDGATSLRVYGGMGLTNKLTAEVGLTHALGDYASHWLLSGNLAALPFPAWRASPFFRLGVGIIRTQPNASLVETPDRTDNFAMVGGGLRFYMTQRFLLRAEYNSYVIFSSRDANEEPREWTVGATVFF